MFHDPRHDHEPLSIPFHTTSQSDPNSFLRAFSMATSALWQYTSCVPLKSQIHIKSISFPSLQTTRPAMTTHPSIFLFVNHLVSLGRIIGALPTSGTHLGATRRGGAGGAVFAYALLKMGHLSKPLSTTPLLAELYHFAAALASFCVGSFWLFGFGLWVLA
ncbi:hypothetical protein BU16DRAFT_181479 [Lophium mytilinum]|uniref:Uncharacterized protein n=1 Tax=Lophium mytilinum TaxID=390894 RepID=A0A6A6QB95_9PEZI|nr:hypothetical protein BU16DRAFT_181479 [Lophium mytilinum]